LGAEKVQQCHKYFLKYSSPRLLPKNLRFEHGGAKLAYCSGRHPTLLRPCMWRKIQVQETIHTDFNFFRAIFAPPVKVVPMARAMPAIP